MKMLKIVLLGLLVSTASLSAEPCAKCQAEVVLSRYADAYNQGDAAALARVYTEDSVLLPQQGEIVRGRGAIEAFWSKNLGRDLDLQVEAAELSGKIGWAAGTWSLATADPNTRSSGHFVVAMRQDPDGVWRLSSDTYNSPCGR